MALMLDEPFAAAIVASCSIQTPTVSPYVFKNSTPSGGTVKCNEYGFPCQP